MDYTQLFRSLREAKGLTIEELAELADCHRNTITNVEAGRPVKFKTVAELMEKMGYTSRSPELGSVALLWLESVSGIPFSQSRTETAALKTISHYRKSLRESARQLEAEVIERGLAPRQIDLLIYAVRHPEIFKIIEDVRELVLTLGAATDAPALKVAEDKK
ncbi:MAG: helix-turn-helix transcriptional regulator [Rariglobus sp.]